MELLDKIERDPNIIILCNTGWGVLRRKAVISVTTNIFWYRCLISNMVQHGLKLISPLGQQI